MDLDPRLSVTYSFTSLTGQFYLNIAPQTECFLSISQFFLKFTTQSHLKFSPPSGSRLLSRIAQALVVVLPPVLWNQSQNINVVYFESTAN